MEKLNIFKNPIILAAILAVFAIAASEGYLHFKGLQANYSEEITDAYHKMFDIKSNLTVAAGNLSATDSEKTSEDFINQLNSAKEILLEKNKILSDIDVPEKFVDNNKKLLDCLKIEYNLINRLKEVISINNEYEAFEDFTKSKDLMIELKEKSVMLSIEGNDFEDILNFSSVYEKIEKYINTRKQVRYDGDVSAQAADERAQREAIQASANPLGYNWIQDKSNGIYMQNPSPVDGESISWSGGYVYEGNYKYASGYGTTTWTRYGRVVQVDEGNFIKGKRHGEVTHKFYPGGRVGYSRWDNGIKVW